ncbi:MAG TPA: hypothetical protein VNG33_19930 [Polyangiaceae bacterium]|nr:hypothetical protein [Polyangiaceae bacterium]
MAKGELGFVREGWSLLAAAVFLAGCSAAPGDSEGSPEAGLGTQGDQVAPGPEDGLADAFNTFLETFTGSDFDALFRIGYGFHPGLSTEKVKGPGGGVASGQAVLDMNSGKVSATLNNVPSSGGFELWLVKNVAGGSMAPEATDQMVKVGKFSGTGSTRTLNVSIGTDVGFDMDLIVVTRAGKKPTESRIAVGDRTLFEKRLFRFREGKALDAVTGPVANNIETTDPLVARGAQLFFNETFGGNGRTCGTCHRADDSLTIDPAFIAKLPKSDPLFVAETNPALAKLENPQLLRSRALILENVDGFDDPTHKFVMRGVPHTLSLGLTNGINAAGNGFFGFGGPPDHRLGWSGDGGPGRSTLHEFTFGAIIQHFTKTLARKPGVDFRVPTEEELDALEAFQLFTGRQKNTDFSQTFPTDPRALNGQNLFFQTGCTGCHSDLFGFPDGGSNFDTGVANFLNDLPLDDGFLSPGDGTFNVPPLTEAADTPPFFHNNAVNTIEDAVGFYFSPAFQNSPNSFFIFNQLDSEQQGDMAAFLRVVNSAANIDQVRKRVQYIKDVRSAGNTDLLNIAIADTRDALVDLSAKNLNMSVQKQLTTAQAQLKSAKASPDRDRPAAMKKLLNLLDQARADLFTLTPPSGGGNGTGGGVGMGGDTGVGGTVGTAGTFSMGGSFSTAGSATGGAFADGGDPGIGGSGGSVGSSGSSAGGSGPVPGAGGI